MGLFFDVLSAVNNPNQQASIEGLSSMTNAVQQLAGKNGLDAAATQSLMSAVGGALGPILQQQATAAGGTSQLAGMISQFAGTTPLGGMMGQAAGGNSMAALQSIIPAEMQQQLINSISQKTGMNAGMIQSMLPSVLPIVMNFFNMGASAPGGNGGNPLLSAFLDSNQDGNTDLGDVMKFAGRFLNAPQ